MGRGWRSSTTSCRLLVVGCWLLVCGLGGAQLARPRTAPGSGLSAAWTALGPAQIASQSYGLVTGRVTGVAMDPGDATGNTVYVGTTGGGVWKSVNAAGAVGSVAFTPLTDALPVFSANAGTAVIPSLSIGAMIVGPAASGSVVLAGTGDTNDATDSYYGEGILRSADGGLTWTLTQGSMDGGVGVHSFVGLGVAGFAWSSTTPGLVVAAVSQAAEGVVVNAPDATYSEMGLYYSIDAGVTWHMATIEDGSQVVEGPADVGKRGNAATAVVWNAARQMFYAAVRGHGYYESPDGAAWTRMANQPGAGLTAAACPVVTSAGCPIFRGALAVQAATGDTFALTVDANNVDQGLWQDVCASGGGGNCAGGTVVWGMRLGSGALEVGGGVSGGSNAIAQGDYDLALGAVATGAGVGGSGAADTLLFVGTVDLYRCSLAAGCVLRNTTNAANGCAAPAMVAPAQHAIAGLAGAGVGGAALMYFGNDGGVWRSVDGVGETGTPCSASDATHFENLNGGLGSLAEVVSFAEDPGAAGTLLVGMGANGTAATATARSAGAWPQVSAGEGGSVAIDPVNPLNWYVSTEAGVSLRYCGKGSGCAAADFAGAATIGYAQVDDDASLIDEPVLLDPALTSDVVIGTCRVWRGAAQSGAGWRGGNAIGAVLGVGQSAMCNGTSDPSVRSLAAGGPASGMAAAQNAGSTVLYAGLAGALDGGGSYGGHVFAELAAGSAGGTTVWTDAAKSPVTNDVSDAGVFNPGGFDVSSVAADAHDATGKTVYATLMGFSKNGINAPHVYRSVDGGASWAYIGSNLPDAPANAVLVDPNDANTVYAATDAGMYVTTSVTSCATMDCWSVLGVGLPNAPVVALQAGAGIATGDGRFGMLRVGTYGRGIWEIPLLTAAGAPAPGMTLSPGSLTFAAQAVGTASAWQTILVTNLGTAALTVSQVVTSGDFTETNNCVGAAGGIAVGGSCSVQVTFLPTATGTRMGVLTVFGNVAGGQATVGLSGTGVAATAIVLTPISVTYSATTVGTTSTAQFITISNTGGVAATLGTVAVTGDFTITANTCGAALGSGAGCTVGVAFAPTAAGTRTGSLIVTDSAGTQTTALSGVGQLAATDGLAPLSLSFAATALGTASAAQAVTLTNTGDETLTLVAATISSGDFSVVSGCGTTLAGHASCTLQVTFVPKSVGARTGSMTVADVLRTQTVVLNGVGVAPAGVSLSPVGTVGFVATGVGLSAAAQTVTLTNNGGLPLTISSFTVSGDFVIISGTNTCGSSVSAGAACTLSVTFSPTTAGARTGVLTVTDSAATSPQTLLLTGTGVDFALAAAGSTTATIAAGSEAVFPLLLTSAVNVPGTVTFTCAPVPAHATCVVNPSSAALGGTVPVTVTIATSVAGAALQWPAMPGAGRAVWLVGLLPLVWLGGRRRRGLALLCGLALLAGCQASRIIPETGLGGGTSATPTPSGTYSLVVSGASAGLVRTVGLVVVVQ